MRMRHTIIFDRSGSTLHFPHKGHDFLKTVTERKTCVLIFSTYLFWNISHPKNNWAKYDKKMYIGLHAQYLLFLLDFN